MCRSHQGEKPWSRGATGSLLPAISRWQPHSFWRGHALEGKGNSWDRRAQRDGTGGIPLPTCVWVRLLGTPCSNRQKFLGGNYFILRISELSRMDLFQEVDVSPHWLQREPRVTTCYLHPILLNQHSPTSAIGKVVECTEKCLCTHRNHMENKVWLILFHSSKEIINIWNGWQ